MLASRAIVVFAFAACACSPPAPPDAGGMDASLDGIDALDARDVPLVFSPHAGCNGDSGLPCNGDWVGRCDGGCAPGQCCSPQAGQFTCVAPDPDGQCPGADIFVDTAQVTASYAVEWAYFAPTDCALVEMCINAPGWRRLMRFDTDTPNTGTADLYVGFPSDANPLFEYSWCHRHYHFVTYADYDVLASDGSVTAHGHKQAFCLDDSFTYPRDPTMPFGVGGYYNCAGPQGIQRGWQDAYERTLPCQWVDITDVAEGDYTLRISLNTAHLLDETNYTNDISTVPVTVPPDDSLADPTIPCATPLTGAGRNCGWTREGVHTCAPGARVEVGCSASCGLGSCTGDTVLRAYEGDRPTEPWDIHAILASNDDSLCTIGTCSVGGDCCSDVMFSCPASGTYTVVWGAHAAGAAGVTCTVATNP